MMASSRSVLEYPGGILLQPGKLRRKGVLDKIGRVRPTATVVFFEYILFVHTYTVTDLNTVQRSSASSNKSATAIPTNQ